MPIPLNIEETEVLAREKLPPEVYGYYSGGSWDGETLRENCAAYRRLPIHYHILRDVSQCSTACELFGEKLASPIFAAPTAFHRLAHPEGEAATALGVGRAGSLMTLSSLSTLRLEDVAVAAAGPLWFQMYINKDRGFTRALAQRAVAAGYKALVVTADTPRWGVRETDVRNGFHLPPGIEPVNLMVSHEGSGTLSHQGSGMGAMMSWMLDPSLTWNDIAWLAEEVSVPVLVKGICRADDAGLAMQHGAAGVIVSNHGGRQLDSAPATVTVLPAVVEAVGDQIPVLIDGGIRRGTDALKALALGARAVLVGRPVLWGLTVGGAEGVTTVLEMLRGELELAMALAGCPRLSDLTPDLITPS